MVFRSMVSPLILKTEYHLSRASAAAAGHFFMFTLSLVPFAWPARGEVSPPAGGEDGGYFAAPAASDFANSGKVTKAPFRNLRFLKISLRKPLALAGLSHPARGCKSKEGDLPRPLPLVSEICGRIRRLVYMARLGGCPRGAPAAWRSGFT